MACGRCDLEAKDHGPDGTCPDLERKILDGCSDGNCVIRKPVGMHTNGGCRCLRYPKNIVKFRAELAAMKLQVESLQNDIASRQRQMQEWYDKLQGTDANLAEAEAKLKESNRLIERLQNVAAATRAYAEHFNMSACNAMETTDTMRGLTIKVAMVDALDALDNPTKPLKRVVRGPIHFPDEITKYPEEWIVLSSGDPLKMLGHGKTVEEAITSSGVDRTNPHGWALWYHDGFTGVRI